VEWALGFHGWVRPGAVGELVHAVGPHAFRHEPRPGGEGARRRAGREAGAAAYSQGRLTRTRRPPPHPCCPADS